MADLMDFTVFLGFPYQSKYTGVDSYNNPIFDRAVDAVFYRNYWKNYFTDGVFPNPATNLQVVALTGLDVIVRAGTCHIQGTTNTLLNDTTVTLPTADPTLNIVYSIVLRSEFDDNRQPILKYKLKSDGLERSASAWELGIADINLRAQTTSILTPDITDTRLNPALCGIVTGAITTVDTSVIFNQIQAYTNQQISNFNNIQQQQTDQWQQQTNTQQANWLTWFNAAQQDIVNAMPFNFDNLPPYANATRTTIFNTDGSITENIIRADTTKAATRTTIFNTDGTITINETVYALDGTTVIRNTSTVTAFGINITETVTNA